MKPAARLLPPPLVEKPRRDRMPFRTCRSRTLRQPWQLGRQETLVSDPSRWRRTVRCGRPSAGGADCVPLRVPPYDECRERIVVTSQEAVMGVELRRLSAEDLEAEAGTILPAKEVLSVPLLDLNIDVDLALALAAPIDLAVAGNLNVALPIAGAVSANVLSIESLSSAMAKQAMMIDQYISGEAVAQSDQASVIDQTHDEFGDGTTVATEPASTAPAAGATTAVDAAPAAAMTTAAQPVADTVQPAALAAQPVAD